MTKGKLLHTIAKKAGYSKDACERVVDAFFEAVSDSLASGERLMFKEFMIFEVVEKGPQRRRNPKTGDVEEYPAHKSIRCKPSKVLKDRINGR